MARVQVPNLITPIVAGTPSPPNLPGQQLPDYAARAKEGVEAGQQLLKSHKIASQSAAQAAAFDYQKQLYDQYKTYSKWVDSQPWSPDKKAAYISIWGTLHGMSFNTEMGGSVNPQAYAAPFMQAYQQRVIAGNVPQGTNAGNDIVNAFNFGLPGPGTPRNAPLQNNQQQNPPVQQNPPQQQTPDNSQSGVVGYGNTVIGD